MILAACRIIRRLSACTERIGDRQAEAKLAQQPRQRLPGGARAAGPGPGRALVPAQPQPARRQRPARAEPGALRSSARRPGAVRRRPVPRARPAPVLLEHLNAALRQLPASPGPHPRRRPPKPAPIIEQPARHASTTGPGIPARRCATTSNPSSTKKPGETSTGPGRPATTSRCCSERRPGRRRPAVRPRRPGQLPAGRARRRYQRGQCRAVHRRSGTTQPLTGQPTPATDRAGGTRRPAPVGWFAGDARAGKPG